jgi:hypothetical protein
MTGTAGSFHPNVQTGYWVNQSSYLVGGRYLCSWGRETGLWPGNFHVCSRLRLKCDGKRAETGFRLSAKRTSPFHSAGASVLSTTGSRVVHISGNNAGYTMFRGSVKGTGYPLHSPVSPSLPLPCVTVCRHISTGLYRVWECMKLCRHGLPPLHCQFCMWQKYWKRRWYHAAVSSSLWSNQFYHVNDFNTLRTGLLNCLNARSRCLIFRHRASCI